jgi:hypothetical protein
MAKSYTFKIKSVCPGGEHVTIDIYLDGELYKTRTVSREDINTGEYQTWDKIMTLLIAKAIKHSGAKTDAEYVSAIESASIIL